MALSAPLDLLNKTFDLSLPVAQSEVLSRGKKLAEWSPLATARGPLVKNQKKKLINDSESGCSC